VEATEEASERGKHAATLQECTALLRGPTDERRLVGLLLVTRLLKAEEEGTLQVCETLSVPCGFLHSRAFHSSPGCAQLVAEAVGGDFLARLLHSGVAGSDGGAGAQLAAVVTAALARCPSVAASHPLRLQLVPQLLSLAAGSDPTAGCDALDALSSFACADPSHPFTPAALTLAARALKARGAAARPGAALLAALFEGGVDGSGDADAVAELAAALPDACALLAESPEDLPGQLALLRVVLHLLPLAPTSTGSAPAWASNLATGLSALLRARSLPPHARTACLSCSFAAAQLLSPCWLACDRGALLAPLVEVTVVEATVAMHEMVRDSRESLPKQAALLGLSLSLFECCVQALAADQTDNNALPDALARAALRSLGRLAGVLFDFVEEMAAPSSVPPADAAKFEMCAEETHPFVPGCEWHDARMQGAVRALGCFLAEVPGAHRDRLHSLLKLLLAAAPVAAAAPLGQCQALSHLLPALVQATDTEADTEGGGDDGLGGPASAEGTACALVDLLVEARGCAALAALTASLLTSDDAAAGGAHTQQEAHLGASLGILRNVAVRGVRYRGAGADPQAAQARAAVEAHVPAALRAALGWARKRPAQDDLPRALCHVEAAASSAGSAEELCSVLESIPV